MQGSGVLGIKFPETASDPKFVRFFSIVQDAASALGKVFFMDSGEGRDLTTVELDGEDLSGWLIDKTEAESFEPEWLAMNVGPEFDGDYCFAVWALGDDGRVSIEFEFTD